MCEGSHGCHPFADCSVVYGRVFWPLFSGNLPSNWDTKILQMAEGEFSAEMAEVLWEGWRTSPGF